MLPETMTTKRLTGRAVAELIHGEATRQLVARGNSPRRRTRLQLRKSEGIVGLALLLDDKPKTLQTPYQFSLTPYGRTLKKTQNPDLEGSSEARSLLPT